MARRWAKRLGLGGWNWRTCWRSVDFWLIAASIVLPLGFLLLLIPRHPLRVTVRRFRT